MKFRIEVEQEVDARWIAEIMDIPGVMVYGESKARAIVKVKALALRVLADWVEDEDQPERKGGKYYGQQNAPYFAIL